MERDQSTYASTFETPALNEDYAPEKTRNCYTIQLRRFWLNVNVPLVVKAGGMARMSALEIAVDSLTTAIWIILLVPGARPFGGKHTVPLTQG